MQMRFGRDQNMRICVDKDSILILNTKICIYCDLQCVYTIDHMLFYCPIYKESRKQYNFVYTIATVIYYLLYIISIIDSYKY